MADDNDENNDDGKDNDHNDDDNVYDGTPMKMFIPSYMAYMRRIIWDPGSNFFGMWV